jgi:hypothetical protein
MTNSDFSRKRPGRPNKSPTVYERLKDSLLDNWAVASLVMVVVGGSAVVVFVQRAKELVTGLRSQVTMAVTLDQGAECGPGLSSDEALKERAVLDVAINNNSTESVMITAVRLTPIKVTGSFYAGELEVTREYDVLVDDWHDLAMLVTVPEAYGEKGEARRASLVREHKAWSENGWWWVRPSPLEVRAIAGAKFTIVRNTAERFRIRMGLSRPINFLIGEINLEIETDRAGRLSSGPHTIAICTPDPLINKHR